MTGLLAFLALFLLVPSCSRAESAASRARVAAERVVAFVNVTVVPMDDRRIVEGQTVVVADERIVTIGPVGQVEVPQGALIVDGAGAYLLPGLAEMHGHVPPPTSDPEFIENVLFLYVANGVTTVRGMLGWPGQLDLRERANRGEIVAPTLYLAGPSFSGSSISSVEQAERRVRDQHAAGWNLLKVHPGLTRAQYDAMATTANDLGIRFGGHVPEEAGLIHALEMGQETFDHLDGYIAHLAGDQGRPLDPTALSEIVERTREAGAWVVPTMALWELLWGAIDLDTLSAYPELRYVPADMVTQWKQAHVRRLRDPDLDPAVSAQVVANRLHLLRALNDGGVGILMGTDAPQQFSVPGFSLHRELARMEAAGMTPYEILRSGTAKVGEYFANEDDFGLVAAGQRADLILVAGNPLDDLGVLASPLGVMTRGNWLPRSEIDARLEEIADSYAP